MGTTMGTGNVHDDDEETLQFADEGEDVWEHDERACAEQNGDCACIPMPSVPPTITEQVLEGMRRISETRNEARSYALGAIESAVGGERHGERATPAARLAEIDEILYALRVRLPELP